MSQAHKESHVDMKQSVRFALILFAVGGACAAGGYLLGVSQGLEQFFLRESSVKASLLAYELEALRAGNIASYINSKEIELDGEVVRFAQFRREGRPWVLRLQAGYERDHTKYMEHVAAYRKLHPPAVPALGYEKDHPMKSEMEQFAKEVTAATSALVKEYGK
jgi:hypothetical protein